MTVAELKQIRSRVVADNPMNVMVDRRQLLALVDEILGLISQHTDSEAKDIPKDAGSVLDR